jgi:hypothetical protein
MAGGQLFRPKAGSVDFDCPKKGGFRATGWQWLARGETGACIPPVFARWPGLGFFVMSGHEVSPPIAGHAIGACG